MKRMLMLPLALAATLVVAAASGAATQTVQIVKSGFTPASATVTAGDTVTWKNADSVDHQVVADDGSFASPVLKPGNTFSETYSKAGTFKYHDALAPTKKGTITVKAPAASVTLSAAAPTVIYGNSTTLSGSVTNQLTNEPVTLSSQPYGRASVQSLAATTTQANGSFSFAVSPTIQTAYQAQWRTTSSPSVTVQVAPRVGLGRSGGLYVAKVTSDLTYAGKYVLVQRRTSIGTWHTLKRVYLGTSSRAVFRVGLPKGRSVLRLALPPSQAGVGYVQGLSRLLAITR